MKPIKTSLKCFLYTLISGTSLLPTLRVADYYFKTFVGSQLELTYEICGKAEMLRVKDCYRLNYTLEALAPNMIIFGDRVFKALI